MKGILGFCFGHAENSDVVNSKQNNLKPQGKKTAPKEAKYSHHIYGPDDVSIQLIFRFQKQLP
jgi:hypothetical protein